MMIPGRTLYYSGWTMEYQRYLMGPYFMHHNTWRVCPGILNIMSKKFGMLTT
ncbi:hypothetical protein DPMN_189132 [Dreissena polymorpha]|uniref:Uncharacterized protein n=1 Tax=Dreissena polymorpha TaxID=45954 RepID=A0A9D4DRE3_DREPO|nr:hypothetical protein DPMN_189132 [Dreissena polymorpha]